MGQSRSRNGGQHAGDTTDGDGGTFGLVAGGTAGALVGLVNPLAGAGAGSAAGQVVGQMVDNVKNERPLTSNLSVSVPGTAFAVVGSAAAKPLTKAAERIVPVHRGEVIGKELGKESIDRSGGKLVGSSLEGALSGGFEYLGIVLGDALEDVGVPQTIQITDKKGNFAPDLTTRDKMLKAK
jgi:hypothetical protein